jgi:hypothetical protein
MQDLRSGGLRALHQGARVSPEEGYDRHAFLEADFQTLLLGKFQVEVYTKRPGRQGARLANLLPNIVQGCTPGREHPQSPGVAHSRHERRPYGTAHRSLDDGQLDANTLAKAGLH